MDAAAAKDNYNPFALPSDEEVFRMRDEEKKRRALEREAARKLPVWKKTVRGKPIAGSARLKTTTILDGGGGGEEEEKNKKPVSKVVRQTRDLVAEARSAVANERRQEKENMADFIAKKREMFLVQMSLDTKREEISKLEEKARTKEEALKKSEQMLEEDAIRFDTFLKENDKKAHEAIKRAEKETRLKTDKVQEIKRLNQQIQMVSSDMSKHKEALEDCLKYKDFLDGLTPESWFEQQRAIKRQRQEKRRAERVRRNKERREKRQAEALLAARSSQEEEAAAATSDEATTTTTTTTTATTRTTTTTTTNKKKTPKKPQQPRKISSAEGARKAAAAVAIDPLESEDLESSGDELPMYFAQPQQLLDIFTQLEEQNLFLIQSSQETEQALEELKQNFEATKRDMDGKTKLLKENIDDLEAQIAAEEHKAHQLRSRLHARAGETQGRQEKMLVQLHEKVKDVYQRCGFDVASHPSTLFMLSELEAKLENLLEQIESMPEDYILKEEKDKEKKRRERKRAEQQALQDAQQEERNRKSIARSLQAPKKRTGRPIMFRSPPLRKTVKHKKQDETKEDEDELKYLT
ncbi:hypothetical protein CTAYLR_005519 [Chrysophaeum taylorii]|uniref:DUF4200 domain-containing protein n=1 Tax=Chrysophaeum taylorii TaxID=2483200 RepID=A0AAD7U5B0_9STRA|nr:hypothetical protein CTAYLR_005519 [Chrysophaeum taylorii]